MVDTKIPVAIKMISSVSTKNKKLFEQEMLAMMKASAHENVLRVLGHTVLSNESGRQSYGIIMELMGGGDLAFARHRDKSVNLSEEDRLQVLLQVIEAIEYILSQGITHRDIKPHNVLLSTDHQTAKLADLGLAGSRT
jgi:serine/threonine protein kinase